MSEVRKALGLLFEKAACAVFPDATTVIHDGGDRDIIIEISGARTLKREEADRILSAVRGGLKKQGLFEAGLILRTLSGIHQDVKEKGMVSRLHLCYSDTQEALDAFLEQQRKAEKGDHRTIGRELDLWTFSDLVGAGLPLFTPKGTAIRDALMGALAEISSEYGMEPVSIPHIAKRDLYDISGHSEKFGDELITVVGHYDEFVMKPVNCPHHTQIYSSRPRTYRDLPVRYMESTMQYRDEQPGELMGLARVRAITVDDGHIFCRISQIQQEVTNIAAIIEKFYTRLGLWGNHWVSLSVRDPKTPDAYIGEDVDWDRAEEMLKGVSDTLGLNAKRCEGEAALYGPKIDYQFTDSLGREWQLATAQIDFAMPKRFGLSYINEKGEKETPVMIHRAILGSYERFLSVLLEHFSGWLPCWLAPTQVVVVPIGERHVEKGRDVHRALTTHRIRAEFLDIDATLGKKVVRAKSLRAPFMVVIGDKEAADGIMRLQETNTDVVACEGNVNTLITTLRSCIEDKI